MGLKIRGNSDPRLHQHLLEDDIQHKGYYVCAESGRRIFYDTYPGICKHIVPCSDGDEATPELDRVIAQEIRMIKSMKHDNRIRSQ